MRTPATFRIDTVIHESASKSFRQVRDRAEIGQVASTLASQDRMQRVMKIVIPLRIKTIATCFSRRYDSRIVEIAFRYHDEMAANDCFQLADRGAQLLEKVNRRRVEDRMDRVDTQSVHAIVAEPHQRVVAEKSPDFVAIRIVEVNRIAPWRAIAICKVRTELREIISLRPQVIVNDVENNAELMTVRRIDEV